MAIITERPETGTDESVGSGDATEDVDQEADGKIGDVFRERGPGIGDGDTPETAIGKVDVVEAGAGGENAFKGRKEAED